MRTWWAFAVTVMELQVHTDEFLTGCMAISCYSNDGSWERFSMDELQILILLGLYLKSGG
jgi:hypothetical protein